MEYGRTFANDVTEMYQGKDDDDGTFWMYLGDDDYAQADYWKWRPSSSRLEPQVWRVDFHGKHQIVPVDSFMTKGAVFVADCIWEVFVVVSAEARGRREDIQLAISLAEV